MNLFNVKLRTGEELLANVTDEVKEDGRTYFLFKDPIQVTTTANGIFVKEWLYFSETNQVWLSTNELMYMNEANKYAADYYDSFKRSQRENEEDLAYEQKDFSEYSESEIREAEELVSAFLESKSIVKH